MSDQVAKAANARRWAARGRRLTTMVAVVAILLATGMTATASAKWRFEVFQAGATGPQATLAGGHPDIRTVFYTSADPDGGPLPIPYPAETPKSVTVDLPPGFAGDPTAAPTCTRTELADGRCPTDSQVGVAQIVTDPNDPFGTSALYGVYLMQSANEHTAELAFSISGITNVLAVATVRSGGDYGLHVELRDLPSEALPNIFGAALTLWGVPADPIHDNERTAPGDTFVTGVPHSAGVDPVPFLANPTRCDGMALPTSMIVDSWQDPGNFTAATADSPPLSGCDSLKFEPSIRFRPDDARAGEPAAFSVDLTVPQSADPTEQATAHVKDVTVKLPLGVVVSPSSADGLGSCTDAQVGLGSAAPTTCPAASKIGSLEIATPLLSDPLVGSIYLGEPKSFDAQTGDMLRLVLVAQGSGVRVKLTGNVTPDPLTGQLRAVFRNNPQLPFDVLRLRFQGGDRAPLTNPQACGSYTTEMTATSWGGQATTSTDSYEVSQSAGGGPCAPLAFGPTFVAGTTNPVAGAFAPFSMTLAREDTDQDLSALAIELPRGLIAKIADPVLCPDATAAVGACSAPSLIGTATVAAGAGARPFYLPGNVYVTGPYKGSPYGLAVVVRAIAGPFDLGTVVVRAQIQVDKVTAGLKIVSDPFPEILQGIPLRLRKINVAVDRPRFMMNPTSCAPSAVAATVASVSGVIARSATRFAVGRCSALPFRPRMTLKVGARGRTKSGVTTPLEVVLNMTPGQANNRIVEVALPRVLNSRLEVVNNRAACTPEQFAAERCPRTIGSATALTPLLRDPLRGSVFLVKNPARRLPDIVVALKGQVDINLTGKITILRNLTINTAFDTIPDVPITRFALRLAAGRGGAVGVVRDLCLATTRASAVARLSFRAQNGRFVRSDQRMSVAGCSTKRVDRRTRRTKVNGVRASSNGR